VILTLLWAFSGPNVEHCQDREQRVKSARCCAVLEEEMKLTILSKRTEMLTDGVALHHDNARPHTAAATVETIQKLKFKLLLYPTYSPDLAPSDYRIFEPLKDAFRGCRFANDVEVKDAVRMWLRVQTNSPQMASGSSSTEVRNVWRC